MPSDVLQRQLDMTEADYEVATTAEWLGSRHPVAAQGKGREVARTIVLRDVAGRYLLAVLPAMWPVDLELLPLAVGGGPLSLASDDELERLFPDCRPEAIPPFGCLYGLPTYVDACFRRLDHVLVPSGSPNELLCLRYADYLRLAHPVVGQFCFHTAVLPKSA